MNHRPILDKFFKSESHKDTKIEVPKLDVIKAGFKYPIVVFDPGGDSELCLTVIPRFLYALLTDKINSGKTFPKSTKEYILNRLHRDNEWNKEKHKWKYDTYDKYD